MNTRAQDPAGDAERALEEALAIAPSPEFLARVRESVRRDTAGQVARWPFGATWRPLAVAGSAALAVLIVLASWNGRTGSERTGGQPAPDSAAASLPSRDAVAAALPSRPGRSVSSESFTEASPAAHRSVGRAIVVRAAAGRQRPLEVLVPDDERRALDRLLLGIRAGRAAMPAPRRPAAGEDGWLSDPPPIVIPLLKPIELLPGTVADYSGSKDQ